MIGWWSYLLILSYSIASSTGLRITLTPTDAIITKKTGDQFVIKCQLSDTDSETTPPTWVKVTNGNDQSITTSGSVSTRRTDPKSVVLMFTSAKEEDAGEYKCKSGEESATVTVKLHRMITFVDTPNVQNPIVGQDAVIKCRADADPKPVISWSKDGVNVAENGGRLTVSDDGDLNIPSFNADTDNGIYTCEAVQTMMGDMKSLEITVTGHVPPGKPFIDLVNKEQWPNGVHEDTTNVRLSCAASGVPPPTYTWFKDGRQIENDHYVVNSVSGVLEFKKINRDDKGTYRCNAKNAVAEESTNYDFNVFEKPRIEKIESKQAMADQEVHFECIFAGTSPLTPSWTHDGNVIPSKASLDEQTTDASVDEEKSDTKHEKYVVVGEGKATLYLKGVKLTDAGEYQCQVSNAAGTISEKANLGVQRAPLIVSSTVGKKVRGVLNTEYSLYCEALAVPPATFVWKKDGDTVTAINGQIEINAAAGGDANHFVSTLKVIPVSDSDFGKYTCEASNGIDPNGMETIELIKIEKPMKPDLACSPDQKPTIVTLTINSYSSAAPETHWPTEVDIVVMRKEDNSFVTTANLKFVDSGHYKIPKLDASTAYLFNVTGKNEAGTSESTMVECSTPVPAPPGKPIFIGSDPIRCNSTHNCAVTWSLDDTGGKPITKFHIQYRLATKEGEPEEQFRDEYTEKMTFIFTDLKPKSTYEIRLRALNDEGWGEVTEIKMVTPEASSPSVSDVFTSGEGPGAGAIVGIVIIIVLLIIVLVDVACYYVNQCGLLMCICVNLCGKTPPEVQKSKEAMMEGGMGKETKIDESYEQKHIVKEQIIVTERLERVEDGTNESTPMISGGQNGHREHKDTTV